MTAALPLLEQQAIVLGPRGQASVGLIGVNQRFANIGGPLLRKFSIRPLVHVRVIALPAPVAAAIGASPFQVVQLQVGASTVKTLLAATLSEADIGGLVDSQVALAPLSYAQSSPARRGAFPASTSRSSLASKSRLTPPCESSPQPTI